MPHREMPTMQYRDLGATGLRVSVLSLGSGGPNRLGQKKYVPRPRISGLIRLAIDMGINFFDTSSTYWESEAILGETLREIPRDRYIVATKFCPVSEGRVVSSKRVVESVERSLKKLRADTIDLLQFHLVTLDIYQEVTESLMPVLENLRREGKFRFLGITESTSRDRCHDMLGMALEDDVFDTIMLAYGPTNRSAEQKILDTAVKKGVGVISVASVRQILFQPDGRRNDIPDFITPATNMFRTSRKNDEGNSETTARDIFDPVQAYKYSISHPAVSTVLTGTTNAEHLINNAFAVLGG